MAKKKKQSQVRNIGIIAHIDAGKTTVTERFLYYTGKTHRIGNIDHGNTVTDWMKQEKERGITITAAVADCPWKEYDIHLIDTPGHIDFTIEVERSLRVLDGAIVVLDAVEGVEPQTETVWNQANRYNVPRMIFINKMDRMGADFDASIDSLVEQLQAKPLPLQYPWGVESDYVGVFDLLEGKAYKWNDESLGAEFEECPIPEDMVDQVAMGRENIIETLSDFDDELAEKFLMEEEITTEELHQAIRKNTIEGNINPVFCGSALRNKGIQPLLDAVGLYLPSPGDLPPAKGTHPETEEEELRHPTKKDPACALVFKIMLDEGRRLAYFRVYSGTLKEGDSVWNPVRNKFDRIARLFVMHGGKKQRVQEISAGFLGAARGLKESMTGDTLCDKAHPILLEEIQSMEPVIMIAIEPESNSDKDDLEKALKKLSEEDPTFRAREDEDTGQIVISGMGELHLDVLATRLLDEFKLNVRKGNPQVIYRETIKKETTVKHTFEREHEDIHLFAGLTITVAPRPSGTGVAFHSQLPEEKEVSERWLANVEQALLDSCEGGGPVGGYPLIDMDITLTDFEEVDGQSNDTAWKIASAQALHKAVQDASPVLLEPLMMAEVVVQDEYMGEIIGDLNARHAEIQSIDHRNNKAVVKALVSLRQMFGYTNQLRSMSQGRGIYTMSFERFGYIN